LGAKDLAEGPADLLAVDLAATTADFLTEREAGTGALFARALGLPVARFATAPLLAAVPVATAFVDAARVAGEAPRAERAALVLETAALETAALEAPEPLVAATDLVATDLVATDLVAAALVATDLVATALVATDLVAADLVAADLVAADLVAADLVAADLVAADLVATTFPARAFRPAAFFVLRSCLKPVAALKRIPLEAAIFTGWPVRGLRPVRAFRAVGLKLPKP